MTKPQGHGFEYERLQRLTIAAQDALQSGDAAEAARLAAILLKKNTDRMSWNYGNLVHRANQLLGLAALAQGDVAAARGYLLAAGRTHGSPQLDSFGPTMALAQALLGLGERDVVLEYLDLVAGFWATPKRDGGVLMGLLCRFSAARNRRALRRWKVAIRAGEAPVLNRVAGRL